MRVLCPHLSELPNISHGFFTREGGVSEGVFVSLNCGFGSGDTNDNVALNRAYVARALGVEASSLVTAYQTHSATAVIVDKPWVQGDAPKADALVTATPGIAVGILAADCLPILLADAKNGVVAAVHSGWKGAIGGVIEAGIKTMQEAGAKVENIAAAIGPGIEQYSYEVGDEFRERFLEESAENACYFTDSVRKNHFMFDLKAYAQNRLAGVGIAKINLLAHDTCLEETRFFSYRRACLLGESAYGRQISAIAIKG